MPLKPAAAAETTSAKHGGEMAAVISRHFAEHRPRRILETGTHRGDGTTKLIADALALHRINAEFVSIELDSTLAAAAAVFAANTGMPVRVLQGLSLPRVTLPGVDQVAWELDFHAAAGDLYADYNPANRAEMYVGESDKPGEDDLIGRTLARWGGRCDFALLDSAGHLGLREFRHLGSRLTTPCYVLLDDVNHVKHAASLAAARSMPDRFTIVATGAERFGFALIHALPMQ